MGLRGGSYMKQIYCSIDRHPYQVSVHVTHLFDAGDQCGDPQRANRQVPQAKPL
jgi:hypothetical protein